MLQYRRGKLARGSMLVRGKMQAAAAAAVAPHDEMGAADKVLTATPSDEDAPQHCGKLVGVQVASSAAAAAFLDALAPQEQPATDGAASAPNSASNRPNTPAAASSDPPFPPPRRKGWLVNSLGQHKVHDGVVYILVDWQSSWEPEKNIAAAALAEHWQQQGGRPHTLPQQPRGRGSRGQADPPSQQAAPSCQATAQLRRSARAAASQAARE
ncbi:hypothetical protein D9Q98_010596 [Chlorella vulgaris]|uniref:Uncharacterized protein n=1 Tax=Chlorella vulgaris TaxID=3077 RepID=A0A9D4TRU8_CHLVU|nr:hypothetical protein D9Q98_010596 [Chlorella vulgaris]